MPQTAPMTNALSMKPDYWRYFGGEAAKGGDCPLYELLANAIAACNKAGKYIGICGQGPSDHPDLAKWLMEQGIESVSLNPDSVLDTWFFLAEAQPA